MIICDIMIKRIVLFLLLLSLIFPVLAQYTGERNRLVVMARFADGLDFERDRTYYDAMLNGAGEESLKSYVRAVSNDRLSVTSDIFPSGEENGYSLKYCYFCYDSNTAKDFPACKGKDISAGYTDVSIGYIINELVSKLPEIDGARYDCDNDGYIDDFVILLSGSGSGKNKGIQSSHVGSLSDRFVNANGEPVVGGKKIRRYTVLYERNSLSTHCRFFLTSLGFPRMYRSSSYLPRPVGEWEVMDGPELTYPLVYTRWKYTNAAWVDNIPWVERNTSYVLNSSDNAENMAYRIATTYPHEYFVLEYRRNTTVYNRHLPASGLLVYRVKEDVSGVADEVPEVYMFRQDGTITTEGNLDKAPFSAANGSSVFDMTTNPSAFTSDGKAIDIKLYDIIERDNQLHFKTGELASVQRLAGDEIRVWFNPVTVSVHITGDWQQMRLYRSDGVRLMQQRHLAGNEVIDVRHLPAGVYVVSLQREQENIVTKIVIN